MLCRALLFEAQSFLFWRVFKHPFLPYGDGMRGVLCILKISKCALSDKKEAEDVLEDEINEPMNRTESRPKS